MIKLLLMIFLSINIYAATIDPLKPVSDYLNNETSKVFLKDPNSIKEVMKLFTKGSRNRSTCKIECPIPKDDYFFRIKDIDFRNGVTDCYAYKKVEPSKVVGTVTNKNKHCRKFFDFELTDSDYSSLGIDTSDFKDDGSIKGKLEFTDYSNLKEIFEKYKSYGDTGSKKYINLPALIIAAITVDSTVLNIQETLQYNKLIVTSDYTLYPNNQIDHEQQFQEQFKEKKGWIASKINNIQNWFGTGETALENTIYHEPSFNLNSIDVNNIKSTTSNQYQRLVKGIVSFIEEPLIFYIRFVNEYNHTMLVIKTFLLFTILPVTILLIISSKATKFISRVTDYDDIIEKIVVGISIIFVFFFSTTTIKTIDDMKISQTNFQSFLRPIFYKTSAMADSIANSTNKAYLETKLHSVGLTSQNVLISTYTELQKLLKEQQVLAGENGVLDQCYSYYKTDKMKEFLGSRLGLNQTFPQSENIFRSNAKFATNGISALNFYTTGENGYLKGSQTQNDTISVSGCYRSERTYLENKETITQYQNFLQMNKNAISDDVLKKQIDLIANHQFRANAELGWISMPIIASTKIFIDNLGIFSSPIKENEQEKIVDDYKSSTGYKIGAIADGGNPITMPVNWFFSNLIYLKIPILSDIKSDIEKFILNSGDFLNGYLSSLFEMEANKINRSSNINLGGASKNTSFFSSISKTIKKAGANPIISFIGAHAPTLIATIITILLVKYILLYLPLIGLYIGSLLMVILYIATLELYILSIPFVIIWAFATASADVIKRFIKQGMILALKPTMFVLSLTIAMIVGDFLIGLNNFLLEVNIIPMFSLSELETNNNQNMMDSVIQSLGFIDMGLLLIKGILIVGVSTISVLVTFYLAINGANILLDILGLRDSNVDVQDSIFQSVDNKSNKFTNPM
jgi:hypothetical protein